MPTATNDTYDDFDFDQKCQRLTNARQQRNINHTPPIESESYLYSTDLDLAMDQLLITLNNTGGQSWQ